MEKRLRSAIRFAAPVRTLTALLVGLALANRWRAPVLLQGPLGSGGLLQSLAVAVFATAALAAARLWLARADLAGEEQIAGGGAAVGGFSAGVALTLILLGGHGPALAPFAGVVVVEWLGWARPARLAERVGVEPLETVRDGVLLPLAGFLMLAPSGAAVPWQAGAVTVCLAAAGSCGVSGYTSEYDLPPRGRPLSTRIGEAATTLLSLLLASTAIGLALTGRFVAARVELLLLSSPIAVMAVALGFMALFDPDRGRRHRRAGLLARAGSIGLSLGLFIVLSFG